MFNLVQIHRFNNFFEMMVNRSNIEKDIRKFERERGYFLAMKRKDEEMQKEKERDADKKEDREKKS